MTHLDNMAETALSRSHNDSDASLATVSLSRGSRWHCAWTHPQAEHRAAASLTDQGWQTYLPLCVTRRNCERHAIVPLWPRYLLVRFDAARDPWGAIQHSSGVGGLIRHAPERPTPLPPGVVEHLLARTSPRGVVDDPGCAPRADIPLGSPVEVREGPLAGLRGLVSKSGPERVLVLLRLFQGVVPVSLPATSLAVVP